MQGSPGFLTHSLNAGYEINVSWYPVSSKLTNYVCEHCRLFEDFFYQKLLALSHICCGYLKMLQGSGFFMRHSVDSLY